MNAALLSFLEIYVSMATVKTVLSQQIKSLTIDCQNNESFC